MKYKFNVVDFQADKNIQTKIAGKEFKLDILVTGSKNSDLEYFRYKNSVRWNDAKKLCENNGWKIASKTDLAKIKNIPRSEYWTDKESGSYAYMFRPPNWTQRMQKNNYKKLYCISDPNQYKTTKFTGQVEVRFVNSDIRPMRIQFNNESKKTITVKSDKAYRNVGVQIIYKNQKSYSEDNFSICVPSHSAKKGVIPCGQLFVFEQLLKNNITKISNVILIRVTSALNLYVVHSHPHIVYKV
jgi:hypothetical protein